MLFVFDENFSKNLADGLNLLEKSNPAGEKVSVDVISAEKFMGRRGATDLELYEAVGKKNGIVFTKDKDFKQIKLLEKIIVENRAKVLFFKPAKKFIFFWDILTAMVINWDDIKETLNTQSPPYVYEFDIRAGISPRNF